MIGETPSATPMPLMSPTTMPIAKQEGNDPPKRAVLPVRQGRRQHCSCADDGRDRKVNPAADDHERLTEGGDPEK